MPVVAVDMLSTSQRVMFLRKNGFPKRTGGFTSAFLAGVDSDNAVEQADSLVANVVTRIAEQFSNERSKLEEQWSKGDNVNTEDLRQALRRYRAFFDRLLSF